LLKHLRCKHPDDFKRLKQQKLSSALSKSSCHTSNRTEDNTSSMAHSDFLYTAHRYAALWSAIDGRPFNFLASPAAHNFLQFVTNGRFPSMSAGTTVNHMHSFVNDVLLPKLTELVSRWDFVSLTTDGWVSNALHGYFTVTAQGIDRNSFELQRCCLRFRHLTESHTADRLAEALQQCLDDFNIGETYSSSTADGASAQQLAIDSVGPPNHGAWNFWCAAHLLHLIVMAGLKAVEPVLKKVRTMVTRVKRSSLTTEQVQEFNRALGIKTRKLALDCVTRWNSVLDLMDSVSSNAAALMEIDMQLNDDTDALQDSDWLLLELLQEILSLFEAGTHELSVHSQPTLCLLLPMLYHINNELTRMEDDLNRRKRQCQQLHLLDAFTRAIKTVKLLKGAVESRFALDSVETESKLGPLCASYLHIGLKELKFLKPQQITVAKRMVRAQLIQEVVERRRRALQQRKVAQKAHMSADQVGKQSASDAMLVSPRPPPRKKTILASFFGGCMSGSRNDDDDDGGDEADLRALSASLEGQLSEYERIAALKDDACSLSWWRNSPTRLADLKQCAARYLGIPATSIASEQVFSSSGHTVSKYRSSMSPQNAEVATMIRMNADIVLQGCVSLPSSPLSSSLSSPSSSSSAAAPPAASPSASSSSSSVSLSPHASTPEPSPISSSQSDYVSSQSSESWPPESSEFASIAGDIDDEFYETLAAAAAEDDDSDSEHKYKEDHGAVVDSHDGDAIIA
jgi:hypothetical protein